MAELIGVRVVANSRTYLDWYVFQFEEQEATFFSFYEELLKLSRSARALPQFRFPLLKQKEENLCAALWGWSVMVLLWRLIAR